MRHRREAVPAELEVVPSVRRTGAAHEAAAHLCSSNPPLEGGGRGGESFALLGKCAEGANRALSLAPGPPGVDGAFPMKTAHTDHAAHGGNSRFFFSRQCEKPTVLSGCLVVHNV